MTEKTITATLAAIGIAASLGITAGAASAQDFTFGKALYDENCAVCHGASGAGDGPVAELFAQRPRNLTLLAKDNGGAFPFSETYQAVKGDREIKGHGDSQMPVWGDIFLAESYPTTFHPDLEPEEYVQGRILTLVYYLQSIQQ